MLHCSLTTITTIVYFDMCNLINSCSSSSSSYLNEMSLAHILERSSVCICLLCVGLVLLLWNSQMILLLCCLSISCLREILHLLVHWPLWRVVKRFIFLRTSPSPITSHFMLFYFSFSSSSCTCSSFSNVQSLSPSLVVILEPDILSTPCM